MRASGLPGFQFSAVIILAIAVALFCEGRGGVAAPVSSVPLPLCGKIFSVAVLSAEQSVLVGERGRVFLTEDSGKTWTAAKTGTNKALFSVCFPDGVNGWAVGQAGLILHSGDSGRNWSPQIAETSADFMAVDFFDAAAGLAVGDNGRIFLTGDGGRNWNEVGSPLYDKELMTGKVLYALSFDSGKLYAAGIDGAYLRSGDLGKTWTQGSTGLEGPELYDIAVLSGFGLAAGSGGNVVRTLDGGLSWEILPVPDKVTRSWLSGVALRRGTDGRVQGWVVGQNGLLGRLENGTLTWR